MKRTPLVAAFLVLVFVPGAVGSEGEAWPQFRADAAHTGANPFERSIGVENVAALVRQWRFRSRAETDSSPAVTGGVVYAAGYGRMVALDAATGLPRWNVRVQASAMSSPTVAGGLLYVLADATVLQARDARTGRRRWEAYVSDLGGGYLGSPTYADGLVYVVRGGIVAVNARSGKPVWQRPYDCFGCSPAVAGGRLFVGTHHFWNDNDVPAMGAFNARTGSTIWRRRAPGIDFGTSSPAVADGLVYAHAYSGHDQRRHFMFAFDARTGRVRWRAPLGRDCCFNFATPAVGEGKVFFAATSDWLYALDAQTGKRAWRVKLAGATASPAVANGVVYVGARGKRLHAFDAGTGKWLWSVRTGAGPTSPTVAGGAVYVHTWDGLVEKFALPPSR